MKEDRLSGLALMHIQKHVSLNAEDMISLTISQPSSSTVSNGESKSLHSRSHLKKTATGVGQGGGVTTI